MTLSVHRSNYREAETKIKLKIEFGLRPKAAWDVDSARGHEGERNNYYCLVKSN